MLTCLLICLPLSGLLLVAVACGKELEDLTPSLSGAPATSYRLLSNTSGSTFLDLMTTKKRQLMVVPKTLTDTTFIRNPRYSNPF